MKNIKKNWKIIVICVLLLFGMNKCTTSCNRASKITKQEAIIESNTHKIDSLISVTQKYEAMIEVSDKGQTALVGIATSNQKAMQDSILKLSNKITSLNSELSSLKKENSSLKKQINEMTK